MFLNFLGTKILVLFNKKIKIGIQRAKYNFLGLAAADLNIKSPM